MAEMKPTVYTLDPDADTIILLKNPGEPFAIWVVPPVRPPVPAPPPQWEVMEELVASSKKKNKKKSNWAVLSDPVIDEIVAEHDSPEGNSTSMWGTLGEEGLTFTKSELPHPETYQDPPSVSGLMPSTTDQVYHYLVSSRHLVLASRQIKSRLTKGGWKESQPDESDGKYHLDAYDWDPEALLILLRILHLQFRTVPRTLSLEMLAKMAVLVNYYRCPEAVELFSEMWIKAAKSSSPVPTVYCRDLVLWMLISWVFKLSDIFQQTTKIAIHGSTIPTIQDMELPIPKLVLDEMEHNRYQAIEEVISALHSWLDKFRATSYSCPSGSRHSFACSSMLLGALTKELDRIRCTNPRPEVPFEGISFDQLITDVAGMHAPAWSQRNASGGYHSETSHRCSFQQTVIHEAQEISAKVIGLHLSKFKDRADED